MIDNTDAELWKCLGNHLLKHGHYIYAIRCFQAGLEFLDEKRTSYSGINVSIHQLDCLSSLCRVYILVVSSFDC